MMYAPLSPPTPRFLVSRCYSVMNPSVLLALFLCALLLSFLFPFGESNRPVRVGERTLARQERLAAAVIGELRACVKILSFSERATVPVSVFASDDVRDVHVACSATVGWPGFGLRVQHLQRLGWVCQTRRSGFEALWMKGSFRCLFRALIGEF